MKRIIPIILSLIISLSFKAMSLPKLSSYPSAKATIFLDFDGHFVHASSWNGGTSFYCTPSGLNDAQITEVFNRVAEDFRPFNINITTDSTVFLSAPLTQRMRIIITLTSSWYPGVGGVSYTRSFTWGDDTPGFVFPDRLGNVPKNIAECCTHESGHTLGLSHQAKYNGSCTLVSTYNDGIGSGETGWAPVMGNSYSKNFSGWNNGPTPSGCTADQDNLSIITSINGFTYRDDDYSDDPHSSLNEVAISNTQFSADGIISTNVDKDVFKFNLSGRGAFRLDAKPFSVGTNNAGANLDIKVTLLNSSKQVINVYDSETVLNIAIDTTLDAGIYYAVIQGAGNENTSNYGSLGSYKVSGVYAPAIVLPISQVLLSGKTDKETHELKWNIITDEKIKNIEIENSATGNQFYTLATVSSTVNNFNYLPFTQGNMFYRLKVTSVSGQIVYSNVISLKALENARKPFIISTLVSSEINIRAEENFKYQLADMSGRILKTGNAHAGVSTINIDNSPNGIYIIQIISNSKRKTQIIVKSVR
jgi:hypothetical protein